MDKDHFSYRTAFVGVFSVLSSSPHHRLVVRWVQTSTAKRLGRRSLQITAKFLPFLVVTDWGYGNETFHGRGATGTVSSLDGNRVGARRED